MISKKLFVNNIEVGSTPRHLPGEAAEKHEKRSQNRSPHSRYLNPGPPQRETIVQAPQLRRSMELWTCYR